MPKKKEVPAIDSLIQDLRGKQIILDLDIARLYEVPTKALLQAVKRNPERFPPDFVFRLDAQEFSALRSQIVTSKGRGGRRYLPLAFTAEGVAMLSSVLQSDRAAAVNVAIMREFVRLRTVANMREMVVRKLDALTNKVDGHDIDLKKVFTVLEHVLELANKPKPKIGFGRENEKAQARVPNRNAFAHKK